MRSTRNLLIVLVSAFALFSFSPEKTTGPNEDLLTAIEQKDLKKVNKAIKAGANVNARTYNGFYPLHELMYGIRAGISEEEIKILKRLVEAGANVNAEADNEYKTSVLEQAVLSRDSVAASYLISYGANVNNRFPLHRACFKRSMPCLVLLVEKGVNVNKVNEDGQTALHLLLEYEGNDELIAKMLEYLHKKGAKLTVTNNKNETLLDMANRNGSRTAAAYLRQNGVGSNIRPSSSSSSSAGTGNKKAGLTLSRTFSKNHRTSMVSVTPDNVTLRNDQGVTMVQCTVVKSQYIKSNGVPGIYYELSCNNQQVRSITLLEVPNLTIENNGKKYLVTGYNRIIISSADGTNLTMDATF